MNIECTKIKFNHNRARFVIKDKLSVDDLHTFRQGYIIPSIEIHKDGQIFILHDFLPLRHHSYTCGEPYEYTRKFYGAFGKVTIKKLKV